MEEEKTQLPEEKIQPTQPESRPTKPEVKLEPPAAKIPVKIPPAKESPYPRPEPESKPGFLNRFWFLFVIAALICLVGIGVLWFLNKRQATPTTVAPTPTPAEEVDEATRQLEQQGTSDEIDEIEADLNATDLTEIDKELTDIDNELIIE